MTDPAATTPACPELEALILQQIDDRGGISFADFMAQALYHPRYGYYMTPRERIGKKGDFFTSTSVHSLFGRLIARQIHQMWQLMGQGDFSLVEQGPGEGHLALDVLNALGEEFPEFYGRLTYLLVEVSPENRLRQRTILAPHLDRVRWCALEELSQIEGCILSNELVDAFAVHLVEKRDGRFFEVFIARKGDVLTEELRPLQNEEICKYFTLVGIEPYEGNRAEVNLEAVRWMHRVGEVLSRGFVLTIDYGYPASELYAPVRRNGTLMGYCRHTANENPLQHIGCQDLTAHVDFTALERSGEQAGLETLWFGEQYRFLMGLGFLETLVALQAQQSDPQKALALRLTLKNLIMPEAGMGETFKVLVQGKAVGAPELLCSRRLKDISLPGIF